MNPAHVGARRAQDHVEVGLELRDSFELDAQLPFIAGKPLVYGPKRWPAGAASNRAEAERGGADGNSCRRMVNFSDSPVSVCQR